MLFIFLSHDKCRRFYWGKTISYGTHFYIFLFLIFQTRKDVKFKTLINWTCAFPSWSLAIYFPSRRQPTLPVSYTSFRKYFMHSKYRFFFFLFKWQKWHIYSFAFLFCHLKYFGNGSMSVCIDKIGSFFFLAAL